MALIRKRRLTDQQQRRIEKQQHLRQQNFDHSEDLEGLIVQHYGRQLEVEVCSLPAHMPEPPDQVDHIETFWREIKLGDIWRCHTRTNLDALVTGDRVTWQADSNTGMGVITALHPRQSLLSRPDRYHKLKPVAANVSLIVIVFAVTPEPSPMLIDRYLVACHSADIKPLLVLNKADLLDDGHDHIAQLLEFYQQLGYETALTSTRVLPTHHAHPQHLALRLASQTVALVGQSGVGKSSLINVLLPDAEQKTNIISENSALGQHTTTSTRLLHFGHDGALIDSPGIREFGLWHLTAEQILAGFVEFTPYYGHCQFRNCSHTHERQCALRLACERGEISQRRLDSMNRLLAERQDV